MTAQYWIDRLQLQPHPEGGYYRETYRDAGRIPYPALPAGHSGPRNFSTAIYFLLEAGQMSALHRIPADEGWHFYAGDPLEVFWLAEDGSPRTTRLGIDEQSLPQHIVKGGIWFGSRSLGSWSLVGCTVAPGFDFADFELAEYEKLAKKWPAHADFYRAHCIR
jgi:uncharacterized protein